MDEPTGLNRSDRDLLISVSTKQDLMAVDIKDIKTDLLGRIVKAEARLDLVDIYHARVDFDKIIPLIAWTENFRANYKFLLALGGILIGILGGLVANFIQKIFHF